MKDKTFRIVVIALLILILGAVLGTLSSFYFPDEQHALEFDEGEFIRTESDYYQFNRYTYEEYGNLVNKKISTLDDIIAYGQENGFAVDMEIGFVSLYRENGCSKDVKGRTLCIEETIEAYEDENIIEHTFEGTDDE